MKRGVRGGVGGLFRNAHVQRNTLAVTKGREVQANMCIKSLRGGIDVENHFHN